MGLRGRNSVAVAAGLRVDPEHVRGFRGVGTNFLLLHFDDAQVDPPLKYFHGPLGG